eukprot:gnl/MRDRNA2_/MRDRNA2_88918_c0_seq1.p1 gnl/MRDRNA2_/MRDRNA2_88918_c0~~gnl/MRDRNA2_/MRDRNA2_88918_c0_seq1.p1  ORF type:complete len:381 (-),score=91.45 gnl/MRDRNA2_/MRDRNA2_88918_c0_seq1:138-1280(-)
MCNGTSTGSSMLSSETPEGNAKAICQQDGVKVRQVVVRELEGLEFPALVLRVHEDEADVVYIDDGQIEHDVPIEELNTSAEVKASKEEIDEIWRKALDNVAACYSSDEDDTPLSNCEQSGRYVGADGTLIISHGDDKAVNQQMPSAAPTTPKSPCRSESATEKAPSEQLASTCASPTIPEDDKDDCDSLSESSGNKPQRSDCVSFSSDSSDDDEPQQSDPNRQRQDRLEVAQFCGIDGVELRKQGKVEEAERQLRRSIDIYEEELGEDHPYTLTSRNNLANVLMSSGKLQDAEVEYRRCLASKLEQLGNDHPVVATTRYNLGLVLSQRGSFEESEDSLKEALRIQVQSLGEEDPEAIKTSRSLCRVFLKQGKRVDILGEL